MSRQPWTDDEINALEAGMTWSEFHRLFPSRTYDSWEVKRRRIPGATAGRGRRGAVSVERAVADELATKVLVAVEEYLAVTRSA